MDTLNALSNLTQWEHEITFESRGLVMFFGGLVISLGLIFLLYFLIKRAV